MTATHRTTITAKCPLGCADVYEAEFVTDRLIPVEVIRAAVGVFTTGPVYQEELARRLADCLQCRVTLTGTHSEFATRTECTPSRN